MVKLHPNYIEKNGKKEFVVLPYEEYQKIEEDLLDYDDLMALRKAKAESAGETPIPFDKVAKELGLAQDA